MKITGLLASGDGAKISRDVREIIAAAMGDAVGFWHDTFREKHFTLAGAREYHYKPRAGQQGGLGQKAYRQSYWGRKKDKRPLVASGTGEQMTRLKVIQQSGGRRNPWAKVILRAPVFNLKNPKSAIDMREELTTVSPPEMEQMTRVAEFSLQRRLDAINQSSRVTFG
ncbi:MAG: hypothetical protein IMZ55_00655 [Acidobacteria bacterium]|nr:hypothetical protein [Planctomycetota bacterium]MBE3131956.1 hypothetical protein [Acidobacteriota bacterium]